MKYFRLAVWTILSLLFITPLVALTQNGECSAMVKAALEATDNICSDTSRNQACYGHVRLEAIPQSQNVPFKFNEVGDRVDVAHVGSLRLSPMDVENDVWGVALMRLQADVSDQLPDSNVTLLVFGDVEVKNAVPELVLVDAIVKGPSNANIRRQPSNRAFVIASIPPGDTLRVKGRSEDGAWLYVELSREESHGWVRRSLLKSENDLTTLAVINPALTSYGPMQAFFLQNGDQQTSCESTPNDGILIQTPEGAAQVRLWINEVKIKLGSTAFIQASPDRKTMVVSTLEGAAHVEALGVEQVAVAGTSVTVRMDENLQPVAPPSLPQAYEISEMEQLPVENLERNITIAAPVNETLIPTSSATLMATYTLSLTTTDLVTQTATDTISPSETATNILPPTEVTELPTNTLLPESSTAVASDTSIPSSSTPHTATSTAEGITGQGLLMSADSATPTAGGIVEQGFLMLSDSATPTFFEGSITAVASDTDIPSSETPDTATSTAGVMTRQWFLWTPGSATPTLDVTLTP